MYVMWSCYVEANHHRMSSATVAHRDDNVTMENVVPAEIRDAGQGLLDGV